MIFPGKVLINQHTILFNIIFGLKSNISVFLVIEYLRGSVGRRFFFDKDEKLQS